MVIKIGNGWRTGFIFATIMGMLGCLFLSRAGLSIFLILFLVGTMWHKNFLKQCSFFLHSPVLVGIAFLFLVPFVSGLWSSDGQEWLDAMRIKLPLLFLPLAFAGRWQLSNKQWLFIASFFLALLIASTCWSFLQYLQNMTAIHQGYLSAKVLATPLQNDHVRYSWLVSIGVLLCLVLTKDASKRGTTLLWFLVFWFALYLHLLSARTGLASLYLIFFFYIIWLWRRKREKIIIIGIMLSIILLPILALIFLPTFQNRIKYFVYDYSYIKTNTYLPGSNDGSRMLSLKGGWSVLKNNPGGVGRGDVYAKVDEWYTENVPQIKNEDRLYPASEWLMYGAAAGWIGVILFTVSMLIPFLFPPAANRIFWIGLNATAAFSLAFDIGLEVQFGVFLYSFIILWWWKWFSSQSKAGVYES